MDEALPGHRVRRVQQLRTAPAPLAGRFGVLGDVLEFRTNDAGLLALAEAAFGRFETPDRDPALAPPLRVRLVLGRPSGGGADDDDPTPLDARHLVHDTAGHLYSISLGTGSRALLDLDRGTATGTISPALAQDPDLVRYAFIEAMGLALATGGRGYVPVHAAGVVRDGVGVVLQGPAGSGKSTLAMACVRRGFGLLAEDVVFARPRDGHGGSGPLEVWGLPWTQRLLPDAPRFFPELGGSPARIQPNGERKLELDVEDHAPGAAVPRAEAGPIVLLARDTGGPTRAELLDPAVDPTEVEVLWPWDGRWTEAHQRTADRLLAAGVVRLHVNGRPDEAVDALEQVLGMGRAVVPS